MKSLLIDTNIYSHAMRGDDEVIDHLQTAVHLGISSISIGELLFGFASGGREEKNRRELSEFLDAPRVRIYPVDENTSEFYAAVLHQLRKDGKPIPTNDIWIAATAFQHGLKLFTKDRHFAAVTGLLLL